MATYKLISAKGTQTVEGTIWQAVTAAIAMEQELQPAYGVTVEDAAGATVAEISDGEIDGVEVEADESSPRTEDAWWAWHDANYARVSPSVEEAEQRCADWVAGKSNDGPGYDTGHVERIDSETMAFVSWDRGVKTPAVIADLRVI